MNCIFQIIASLSSLVTVLKENLSKCKTIISNQEELLSNQKNVINSFEEENKKLQERVEELERTRNLKSHNSSKPPSSDGFKKNRTRSLREKGKKPSGGQKGHKGHTLQQSLTPDKIITYKATSCQKCGKLFRRNASFRVEKRQVFDIVTPPIEVTEHQAYVMKCSCGTHTAGAFPEDIQAPVQYGPQISTLAVYLCNMQLIPQSRIKRFFLDFLGLPISEATLIGMNKKCYHRIQNENEQTLDTLKKSPVKHADETGMHINTKLHWLHVISNDKMTYYWASPKRKCLLEGVQGILVHDHWKSYFQLPDVQHALCNAHHLRELKSLVEIEKEGWAAKMIRFLHVAKNMTDPPWKRLSKIYDLILAQGLSYHESLSPLSGRKNKRRVGHNLLRRLRDFKKDVLRFLRDARVPFTNNQAEQDIRMMKVKQKISGSFRSIEGAHIFCAIRGFISTKRKQKQNIFQAIAQVV